MSKQINNTSPVLPRAATHSADVLPPTRFEYVQLFSGSSWLVAELDRVLSTKDNGRTWTELFRIESTADHNNQIQGLSFVDERLGFLIVGGHLLHTDDGGTNWLDVGAVGSGIERVSFRNCYFISATHGWAVGMVWQEGWVNNSKVPRYIGIALATQDGGLTWQRQRLGMPKGYRPDGTYWSLNDVLFKGDKTGWLVGDHGITYWTKDGVKWHLTNSEDVDYQRVSFDDALFGWATYRYGNSSWGVAMTTDGGRTWRLSNESLAYGTWPVYAVFLTPERGFAISLKLYETNDGGRHWKWHSGGDKVSDMPFHYLGEARDGTLVALRFDSNGVKGLVSNDGTRWQPAK